MKNETELEFISAYEDKQYFLEKGAIIAKIFGPNKTGPWKGMYNFKSLRSNFPFNTVESLSTIAACKRFFKRNYGYDRRHGKWVKKA